MRLSHGGSLAVLLGLAVASSACQNSGGELGFGAAKTGSVVVGVYLDRDGSRTFDPFADTLFANARVALLARGANDTLRVLTTDVTGLVEFTAVPVGEYRVALSSASVGDSIKVGAIDSVNVRLTAVETADTVRVRLEYPEVSIRAARALPLGKRAFVRGVILVGVQAFRDTTSHLSDSSGQIRLTRVNLKGGLTGNSPGDSVSVLGTAATRAGQPTLDQALVARFGARPPPIPVSISSANAATANGGVLDAALVRVFGVIISDSATVSPDFRVTASDGTGSVNILLDANLPFPRTIFRPGRSMNVAGVLVPDGFGGWNLKPRDLSDVVFNGP